MGIAVPLQGDVGADAGRLLDRLYHLDVSDLASGVSGDAAAYQYCQGRLSFVGAVDLRISGRAVRWLCFRPLGASRNGTGRQPSPAVDSGPAWFSDFYRFCGDGY